MTTSQMDPATRKSIRVVSAWLIAAFACCAFLYVTTARAADAVSDSKVKQWIAASLTAGGQSLPENSASTVDEPVSFEDARTAWSRLKSCRDAGKSLDLSLAAAEHYLFMRYVASQSGDTNFREAPGWYEQFKSFSSNEQFQKFIQTSDQPTSPVVSEVRSWGEQGVEKGLLEYTAREKVDPKPQSNAKLAAIGVAALFYYTKYKKPEKFPCDVAIASVGKWDSKDPAKRWRLEFSDGKVAWTERGTAESSGKDLTQSVSILSVEPGVLRIERANDESVLKFLGISPAIRSEVLSRSPKPSYMLIKQEGGTISADWFGLVVTKDDKGKFKELKQPGTVAAKTYSFEQAK